MPSVSHFEAEKCQKHWLFFENIQCYAAWSHTVLFGQPVLSFNRRSKAKNSVILSIKNPRRKWLWQFIRFPLDEIDWMRCARFSFYGGLYVAPTLYTWIRLSSRIFPNQTLKAAISKVTIQFSILLCPKFQLILFWWFL